MIHPDPEVQDALVKLQDSICSWERSTGRQSILIFAEGPRAADRVLCSMSGKPLDCSPEMLLELWANGGVGL